MKGYRQLAPSPSLAPFVDRFWQAAAAENGNLPQYAMIPDGCVDVVYERVGPRVRCLVVGTNSRMQSFRITSDAIYFGIRFRPGMARHFLKTAPFELTDRQLDLQAFAEIGPEQLVEAGTFSSQSTLMERALERAVSRSGGTLSPLDRAISLMQQDPGVARVETLAELCGLGPRQLQRTTMATVGLPPKLLMRILRVQAAITAVQQRRHGGLADVAAALGYSDQAHMNRDFRLLTGSTPTEYRLALARQAPPDTGG